LSRISTSISDSMASGAGAGAGPDVHPTGCPASENNNVMHTRQRPASLEVWQSEKDLRLTALEMSLFQNFVRRASLWVLLLLLLLLLLSYPHSSSNPRWC
jgi:hypothetical protein